MSFGGCVCQPKCELDSPALCYYCFEASLIFSSDFFSSRKQIPPIENAIQRVDGIRCFVRRTHNVVHLLQTIYHVVSQHPTQLTSRKFVAAFWSENNPNYYLTIFDAIRVSLADDIVLSNK